MEVKDFLQDIDTMTEMYADVHEKLIAAFDKDPSTVSMQGVPSFLWYEEERTCTLGDTSDVPAMMEEMHQFVTDMEEYKAYPAYSLEYEVDDDYDSYINYNHLKAVWQEPKGLLKDEVYLLSAKTAAKKRLNIALKPLTALSTRVVDCKFLSLWVDGSIDWKTLQQIVYSDCKL